MGDEANQVMVNIDDGIMTITINRPEVKNAINRAVTLGVAEGLDELDARDDLRVGILTGAGGTFCAGMDLKAYLRGEVTRIEGRGILGIAQMPPKKPMIAAVEGYALAGGFEAVLACDLLVAGRSAQFGIPEVKRGLAAMAGGLMRLPRRIPEQIAMEAALTGEFLSAKRLYHFGLVNKLVEDGGALAAATEMAKKIIANAPLAVAASKRVIVESRDWPIDQMFARQAEITSHILGSEDAREGAKAFAEKRPANWKGR